MCDDYEMKAPGNEVINKNGEVLDRRSLPRYVSPLDIFQVWEKLAGNADALSIMLEV